MYINVQTFSRFHHQRSLNCIFIKQSFSKYFLAHSAAGCIYLTQFCMIILKFITIEITWYPESIMVSPNTKLCHFISHNKMIEFFLRRKFVPETNSIIKNTKDYIY